MSQRFYLPREQVFTNLGAIGAGWKLYTYETGTTTPKATYSNTTLSVANANPTIADSSGRFGDIFVSDLSTYKAILKDSSDNTIWTSDPVDPKTFTLADFDPAPVSFWGTTAGTSTVYTLAADPTQTAYSSNSVFYIKFHTNCGASPTLNIDSLGTLNLKKRDGAGTKVALEASDVLVNYKYAIENDGTDLVVLNPEKPYFDARNLTVATETEKGVAEIATQAEVDAATSDTTIITPLKQRIIQVVNTSTSATATTTAIIPIDNTIPQNTEGTEFMTLAITPKSATNKLKIDVVFNSSNSGSQYLLIALFRDSDVNAFFTISDINDAPSGMYCTSFTAFVTAGTTSPITFRLRAGTNGNTLTFNGQANGQSRFGGTLISSITITEIKA